MTLAKMQCFPAWKFMDLADAPDALILAARFACASHDCVVKEFDSEICCVCHMIKLLLCLC